MQNNNSVVVQSNKLIEAHYKQQYTVQELRMVLWVISEINKQEHYNKIKKQEYKYKHQEITISAQKYAELMDITVDDVYKRAKEIGNNLMQKVLTISTDDQGWKMLHWLEVMEYIKTTATIKVLISSEIIPYIIKLHREFTQFRLENILHLRSSYAIKLYQILAQYKLLGEREITVDILRNMLGINEQKTYSLFAKIKSKILEISKREINKKTDLTISYSEIKTGKKVTALKFKITQKPNQETQAKKEFEKYILQLPDGDTIKTLFQTHGFNQTLVKTKFQEFLAEKVVNYNPESSKPITIKL
jgi:plasmid replication initiation protein